MNRLRFISFSSGSCGNASYFGTLSQGILIDAGVSPRALKRGLLSAGIPAEAILGVCLTHDHIDHVKYAGAYGEKLGLELYTTETVHRAVIFNPRVKGDVTSYKRNLLKGKPFHLGPFCITAFEVPHDGQDNMGYMLEYEGQRLVIATDLGHIPDSVSHYLQQAHYLVLEANYDQDMLDNGTYPAFLKKRINQPLGHLANHTTATYMAAQCPSALTHLFLCHLSQENNRPELAYRAVASALEQRGLCLEQDIQLHCLPRAVPSPCFILQP